MMINRILRHQIGKISIVRYLYCKFLDLRMSYKKRNEQNFFIKVGDDVVSKVQKTLSQTSKVFFFDMGTLLGIYRDGRLLKRDMDIDVGVQISSSSDIDEIRSVLSSNNFIHKFIFSTDIHGVIQDTFTCEGITVDISYYRQEGNQDYIYMIYNADDVLKMLCHHVKGVMLYSFGKIMINVPENTDLYLTDRYGKDWKIPDPNYKYWEGPSVVKVEGHGICEKLIS